MTIDYNEEEILSSEKCYNNPFIGYINPKGDIIDFSLLIGEPGHGNWRNPITPYFLNFISFVVLGENIEKYKNCDIKAIQKLYEYSQYKGFDDIVRRGLSYYEYCNEDNYDSFLNRLNDAIKEEEQSRQRHAQFCKKYNYEYRFDNIHWNELRYDLMQFFKKCYSKKDFFYSFNRIIKVQNMKTICNLYKNWCGGNARKREDFYYDYCVLTLMSYFKDIMVQYLGYDSIERANPDFDLNIINNLYEPSYGYKFSNNPKTILTSCSNPNERFYNWMINDWNVKRVPRMYWNEEEKRFVEESPTLSLYQTDKEEILSKEIDSIRREVPKQYRKQYFRN